MALMKLARMGHPVLRTAASPVEDPDAPEVSALVRDMMETMADAGGVGLAAPQVHVARRVVVFHVPPRRAGDPDARDGAEDGAVPLTVLINPEIEPLSDERVSDWEACLSVPGLVGLVPRFARIRYRWTDFDGQRRERMAAGFHARVVQHECDHLDGILYPQRVANLTHVGFVEEMRQYPPAGATAAPEEQKTADERQ